MTVTVKHPDEVATTKGIPSPEEYKAMQTERHKAAVHALIWFDEQEMAKIVIEALAIVEDGERQLPYAAEMDELRKLGDDSIPF